MYRTQNSFAVGTCSAWYVALQGIKLELFIFDTLPMASKISLLEVRSPHRTRIHQPALPDSRFMTIAALPNTYCTELLICFVSDAIQYRCIQDWLIRMEAAARAVRRQTICCLC